MKSDELIQSLAAELTPVQRLPNVGRRSLVWCGFALACVWLSVRSLGPRADLADKLHDATFVYDAAALLLLFSLSAWCAFRSSIPGLAPRAYLPVFGLLAWLLSVTIGYTRHATPLTANAELSLSGINCVWRLTLLSAIPLLSLFYMLRRAAPLERGWTGLFAVVAVSSIALLGTQILCAKAELGHVLIWHVAPLVVACLSGIQLGKLFLNGSNQRAY